MNRIFFYPIFAVLVLFTAHPAFSFSPRAIPAKACIIMSDDDSILYAKNPSAKLPPASTVKLVTAMVALDRLDPETRVTMSRAAAMTRSSKPRLAADDEVTVSDLLHLALMKSTNSAAVALAEAAGGSEDAFVELMNGKVQEIGANDTHFANASGLPEGRQYTTVRDLTIILKKALTYPLIKEILAKKEWVIQTAAGRQLYVGNTDALLWYRSNMVGGKTGFTNNARHCFVGAMDTDKGLIYTAVLGAPSRSRLWKSTLMLADFSENPQLLPAIEERPVQKRKARSYRKSKKRARLESRPAKLRAETGEPGRIEPVGPTPQPQMFRSAMLMEQVTAPPSSSLPSPLQLLK